MTTKLKLLWALSIRSFMVFWLFGNEYFVSVRARTHLRSRVNVSEKTLFDEFILQFHACEFQSNSINKYKYKHIDQQTEKSTFRLISKHPSDIVYYAKGSSEWSIRRLHDDIPNTIYPSLFFLLYFSVRPLCLTLPLALLVLLLFLFCSSFSFKYFRILVSVII